MPVLIAYVALAVLVAWTVVRRILAVRTTHHPTGTTAPHDFADHADQALSVVRDHHHPAITPSRPTLPTDDAPPPLALNEPFGPPRWIAETLAPATPYLPHLTALLGLASVLVLLTS